MTWKKSFAALVAIILVGGSGWTVYQILDDESAVSPDDSGTAFESTDSNPANRIRFSETQKAHADLATEPVRRTDMQLHRVLPGRFAYDDTKHVAIRMPTDGVLRSVLVKVGDSVDKGDPIAELSSPPIGDARNRILAALSEQKIASKAANWENEIHDGVRVLVDMIRDGQPVEKIEQMVSDQTTGMFGGRLLTAYSKSMLAEKIARSVGSIGDSGAISGRIVRERESDRQQAAAELQATIEQALFETEQAMLNAQADLAGAERKVLIARQTLATLIGSTPTSASGLDLSPNDTDVSRLTVRSPISGTVERRTFSATERVSADEELFVIADTAHLWVEADIRNRDWGSIHVREGDTVSVTVPSVNGEPQTATVHYVGRQVDPQTGAIPLVAQVDNSNGRFRPGQFARVSVPTQMRRDIVTVPRSAVVDLEGIESVFVSDGDGYFPVPVELGEASEQRVEIRQGLSPGQVVVVSGAFLLKSQLLLEGEE
ncbi:efflux RND transporter periplasmic adaptor subunit [Rhodopirellula sallentina]|uniref:Efflux transporter RND family, MFP subunit n=1 Tax=Rhodopirellula sallentina SM41 TaxID=1263870 RepID=M5U5T1_9BACT|nr:efflux RND transporter periplasmic adaptor subunit [Rhodopirellula sallentina]EMI56817.1 efflux transporter RND family, MFP subunit [Rhodopirellula sallentina SM41]